MVSEFDKSHAMDNIANAQQGGFAPHIDSVAYTHVKNIKHLTILLAIDPSNMANGGLEVVKRSHEMDIPINEEDHCIENKWVKAQEWAPVELDSGQYIFVISPKSIRLNNDHRGSLDLWVISSSSFERKY